MTAPTTELTVPDTAEDAEKPVHEPLTLKDRCCACSTGTSQAFVRVFIRMAEGQIGDLLFCGHHFAQHEAALAGRDTLVSIHDEREKINEKPSQSSANV